MSQKSKGLVLTVLLIGKSTRFKEMLRILAASRGDISLPKTKCNNLKAKRRGLASPFALYPAI
jgi:ABC-type cobalamin/Fe3+-siderophores transport system ATPase subunit